MIEEASVAGAAFLSRGEREYRAGREAAGLVTLARGTLDVSGPKRQDYLHAMLSNDVNGLRPGEGCRAASMSAKGSLQAFLRVLVGANVVVLETEAERLPLVLRTLEHHKVGAPVRFASRPTTVLALVGPRAGSVLEAAGASSLPEGLESHAETRIGDQPVGSSAPAICRVTASCCTRRPSRRTRCARRSRPREPRPWATRRSTRCASSRSARGTART